MSKHVFHLPLLVQVIPYSSSSSSSFTSLFELGPQYVERKLKLNCRIMSLSKDMSGSFVSQSVSQRKLLRCNYLICDWTEVVIVAVKRLTFHFCVTN